MSINVVWSTFLHTWKIWLVVVLAFAVIKLSRLWYIYRKNTSRLCR